MDYLDDHKGKGSTTTSIEEYINSLGTKMNEKHRYAFKTVRMNLTDCLEIAEIAQHETAQDDENFSHICKLAELLAAAYDVVNAEILRDAGPRQ